MVRTVAPTYTFGITFVIIADILCLLTIIRLRKEIKTAIHPISPCTEMTVGSTVRREQIEDNVQKTVTIRQKKAFYTLMLIVVFFNLTVLPFIAGFGVMFFGVKLPGLLPSFFHLVLFANSIVNPFIIATRTEDIRKTISVFILDKIHKVRNFICFE